MKTSLPYLLVALPLSYAACSSGTETDNPFVSPVLFEPPPPAEPGCPPSDDDGPPRELPLWGLSGSYLVGVDAVGTVPRRGLVVVDVSQPGAPEVVAEQPLAGRPRQLLVEGTSVTLVLDELPQLEAPPPFGGMAAQTKLIRFDLSSPDAPNRIAAVELDGEFWQLQARDGSYWVLSARTPPELCGDSPNLCGYIAREAMLLTRYTWSGSSFVADEQAELPAGPRVWLTETGVATASSNPGSAGLLSFAAFAADGGLAPVQTLPLLDGIVRGSPLLLDGERVGLFSYDLSDGSAAFSLHGLDGTELSRVGGLSQGLGAGTHFVPGGALVAGGEGAAGSFLDLRDSSAPSQVALPEASAFLPLAAPGAAPTRALGWRREPAGSATTFTLWELESVPPALLDSLSVPLAAPQSSSELTLATDAVILSLRGADNSPQLARLRWQGDQLSLAGPIAGGYDDQLVAAGDWLYAPDSLGLAFGNPAQGSAQRQAWDEGSLLDVSAVPGGEARLALDPTQRRVQLFVTRDGATRSLVVSPGARRLLPAGERLIVLSTEPAEQCRQTGLDCSDYAPGIALVELASLSVAAELPLPLLPVPPLGEQSRVEQSWPVLSDAQLLPARLGEQRWLLEGEWLATCLSESDCSALGIQPVPIGEANVLVAQPGCPPGAKSCPQQAPPTVYGEALRRVYHVLDAAAATLSEPLIVEGARGTPSRLWAQPVFSRGVLLDVRLEPSSSPPTAPPQQSAATFWLERYVPNAAGGLDALPPLNIPGYPVALISDSELLTIEPTVALNGAAVLHRLRLEGDVARLQASRALQARAGTVHIVGDKAVYLRAPADRCDFDSHVDAFALDAELSQRGLLELPGDGWSVAGSDSDGLVLQRDHGFARIDLDAWGNASLAGFVTAPGAVGTVRYDAGVVRALSGNRVLRLEP